MGLQATLTLWQLQYADVSILSGGDDMCTCLYYMCHYCYVGVINGKYNEKKIRRLFAGSC
jgi:hypothetical protein